MKQLNEAISAKDFPKAASLIHKYLTKQLGKTFFFPSPEVFTPSGGTKGIGIKFFVKGNKAVRLNWSGTTMGTSVGLTSVDYWDGSKTPQPYPSNHYEFDEKQSLVKVLPLIVDIVNGVASSSGHAVYVTEEIAFEHRAVIENFSAINEATYTSGEIAKTVSNVVKALSQNIQFREQHTNGGNKKYGPRWDKIIVAIKREYPEFLEKQGAKDVFDHTKTGKIDQTKILSIVSGGDDTVAFTASAGKHEEVEVKGATEEDVERMGYEEQLDSLKSGMKLLMANATQSMWIGGRGGTGKTATVEEMLHTAGKTDGEGYFKITGSASPVGIYRILYTHRKDIVLFDDSDSALGDQESRNLFKAASDTKKVRKISWMKGGKNFVDPADYDEENEDDTLPRYFEFTGKIIFISNLPINKLDPDGALRTRGFVMNVDPSNTEIYDYMIKICDKIPLDVDYPLSHAERVEVVELLRSRKVMEKTANLRQMVRGLNVRAGIESQGGTSEEWKKFVKQFA
jgi:hypothetical protein